MIELVVDTSVVIKWFFVEENDSLKANEVLACAVSGLVRILQPELAKYEFSNVLLKKRSESLRANVGISQLYSSDIKFILEDQTLANITYRLAEKLNITYYDASFLAIAKQKNIPLITANPKHQREIEDIKVIPLSRFTVNLLKPLINS